MTLHEVSPSNYIEGYVLLFRKIIVVLAAMLQGVFTGLQASIGCSFFLPCQ